MSDSKKRGRGKETFLVVHNGVMGYVNKKQFQGAAAAFVAIGQKETPVDAILKVPGMFSPVGTSIRLDGRTVGQAAALLSD